jgi:hypothetical protein
MFDGSCRSSMDAGPLPAHDLMNIDYPIRRAPVAGEHTDPPRRR